MSFTCLKCNVVSSDRSSFSFYCACPLNQMICDECGEGMTLGDASELSFEKGNVVRVPGVSPLGMFFAMMKTQEEMEKALVAKLEERYPKDEEGDLLVKDNFEGLGGTDQDRWSFTGRTNLRRIGPRRLITGSIKVTSASSYATVLANDSPLLEIPCGVWVKVGIPIGMLHFTHVELAAPGDGEVECEYLGEGIDAFPHVPMKIFVGDVVLISRMGVICRSTPKREGELL